MGETCTRERILRCACRLFAEKGFRDTTVAEICAEAKANIAAVNYHFGAKDRLYRAVWQHTHALTDSAYPVPELDVELPEIWLRALIRSRVLAILDEGPNGWFLKLVAHEMPHPSPIFGELRDAYLRPGRQKLETAIAALLGANATARHVQCGMANVLSLYAFLNARRRVGGGALCRRGLAGNQAEPIAAQVAEFALAGLRGVRAWMEAGAPSEAERERV